MGRTIIERLIASGALKLIAVLVNIQSQNHKRKEGGSDGDFSPLFYIPSFHKNKEVGGEK